MSSPKVIVRLLETRDQKSLFAMATLSPMKLPGLELVYDRSPEFQKLLQCQGEGFESYVGDVDGDIIGVASISWKKRRLAQKTLGVGYLGDLRMKKTKLAAGIWREFYKTVLSETYKKERGIDCYITAVLAENEIALRNLTRSRHNEFTYHPLGRQKMVNVLARKPWSTSAEPPQQLSVRELNQKHTDFLQLCGESKIFSYDWSSAQSENNFRMQKWPGWEQAQALVYEETLHALRSFCVPWSPTSAKRMQVQNLKFSLRMFLLAAQVLGFPKLVEGEGLETVYLTALNFSTQASRKQKVLDLIGMIQTILTKRNRPHMVSFADLQGLSEDPQFQKHFVTQSTDVLLFAVTRKDEPLPSGLDQYPVDFEMALV